MKYKVEITEPALFDLECLKDYIMQDDSVAAQKVVENIIDMIERVADQPHVGHQGRLPNTREMLVPKTPYILIYQMRNSDKLEILRIYHSSRRWKLP